MAPVGEAVFATLLMNDGYLPGAMVLGHSLRDRGAKAKLACLVVMENLSSSTIEELKTVYDDIVPVQRITNRSPANLYVMNRPDLISTFTKIELWRQTQYRRIIYLDADMVVLRAPNELLTLNTGFAAVPDIGWPDCFNSGMMVLNPNMGDYYSLLALAQRGISFDGADQGLLNMHFTEWERLSFTYNCTPSGSYQYIPAYRHFQSSIHAIHFIGQQKPWTLGRENELNNGVYGELLARWWTVYDRHYRPQSTAYYSGQSKTAPKKLQDYVKGEETIFLPGYSSTEVQQASQPTPATHDPPPQPTQPAVEQPIGNGDSPAQRAISNDYKPTPTVEQRRFSAPHVDWEPARAPPPTNSKPEAANFPTTIYDMSTDRKLFQAPTHYPEPPKDMWYQVPKKAKEPEKPKPIFPWEGKAPKPTRVFAEPPRPDPTPEPEPVVEKVEEAAASTTSVSDPTPEPARIASPDPWAGFQSRTNAWDDIPEIETYMQRFQRPRKAPIQVLHNTGIVDSPGIASPPIGSSRQRKPSLKLTDFPTEVERPSLPVTPAPIRRPSFWGSEKVDEGNLPAAEGVPQQQEWVRDLFSYPKHDFLSSAVLSPHLSTINGVLVTTCQHCGKQNPIAKLEELQRKQSEVLTSPEILEKQYKELPDRQMPSSQSREEAEKKDEKATSPPEPKKPKPILKEPHFGLPPKETVTSLEVPPEASTALNTSANVDPSTTDLSLEQPKVPTTDHVEDAKLTEKENHRPTATVHS